MDETVEVGESRITLVPSAGSDDEVSSGLRRVAEAAARLDLSQRFLESEEFKTDQYAQAVYETHAEIWIELRAALAELYPEDEA